MAFVLAAVSESHTYGIAPDATVLSMRVLGKCSKGYTSDVADAIVWSVGGTINKWPVNRDKPANVVLMPFAGKGKCPSFMQTAVTLATNIFNATLIAAAGNDASDASENFPANRDRDRDRDCAGVISVGSLDVEGNRAVYSAKNADVYVPGDNVQCGTQISCSGTSVAATLAAGAEACGLDVEDNDGFWGNQINGSADMVKATVVPCSLYCRGLYGFTYSVTCPAGSSCSTTYCACCKNCAYSCTAGTYAGACVTPMGSCCTQCGSCLTCSAGTYSGAGAMSCTQCSAGTYSAEGASQCTPCVLPQVQTLPGQSSCTLCPAGQFPSSTTTCTSCIQGKYWAGTGATSCTDCETGKVANTTTSLSCCVCGLGSYAKTASMCEKCPIGTYWDQQLVGTTSCSVCANGKTSAVGSSTCVSCGPGKYADQSYSTCSTCAAGKYSTGAANNLCTDCDSGKYSTTLGATLSSACKACPSGFYSSSSSTSCTYCCDNVPTNTGQTGV
jgi:hypothetical protein